ncbi:hypothetical protein TrispH2_004155 [Trichoplax sp. H2]|uniref:FCP1 homology domain-containing protein n=1 Tax=Trichoplax adhaerens TaxID=10228 RepID=B3RP29_TRIAD|nr:predicted protein [Trichoplax adhaerens]EDV28119.1 predicted protein [Trichoplax adhaerens]RDD43495.1 hypothetical protein TrispH2_004155 [Trichoplax sp. H2]|eukprot:XP_002109953.1 predicted protein [Trichoplax adhaerens]
MPSDRYAKMIKTLQRKLGIKLLAIDFDKTLVDIHTGGLWLRETSDLVHHVRPGVRSLIASALTANLRVCIVTFSSQVTLISNVLKASLPPECEADHIIIRGCSGDWDNDIDFNRCGKQYHLQSVMQELKEKHHMELTFEQVMLIDDDGDNVDYARRNGCKTLLFVDDGSLKALKSPKKLKS